MAVLYILLSLFLVTGMPAESSFIEETLPQKDSSVVTNVSAPADSTSGLLSDVKLTLGTNALYILATQANLWLEVGFSNNFAVNAIVAYSPWNLGSHFHMRALLIQPEFRYYLKEGFTGHHFGFEGHLAWYNIAFPNSRTRYQDRNGNSPAWGFGLTYGYVLPLTEHWGLDFEIGAGYSHLAYDCFYNIDNGARYDTRTGGFWGPTKVGVSVFYRF